jgi:4-aminobutyrate aminotransferase/(S)-3-amino-2-methylpropionate transaminase
MFAGENFDVVPDIMTMAKGIGGGLPLGGVIATPEVAGAMEAGDHYTTYGWNNVVSLATGLKGIEIIEKENLVHNAAEVGGYFLGELKNLQEEFSFFGDVRGLGLFIGIEVVKDKKTREPDTDRAKQIKQGMKDRGILVGVTGNYACVLRITPPLTISNAHVDQFMAALKELLNNL